MRLALRWTAAIAFGSVVTTLSAAPLRGDEPTTAPPPLAPTNYANGELVRHPVVLLRGSAPVDATAVVVTNESSQRDTRVLHGIARKGRFLALAELVPGENRLTLRATGADGHLVLDYKPPTNPRHVRCVYLTDSGGDTAYQSPRADDPQDYASKLDTALKVLQCFTAERMHDLGFGRTTFNLELEANGRVPVHVVRGERPAAEEYALDDQSWWREIAALLERKMPDPDAKSVVVAAYTRFDPAKKKVFGHTALGGGNLGLFGSAGMFAWPSRLDDVFSAFSDTTQVDGSQVHDDSVGRSTYWGLASTTLGAVLHEMGHTFDLPHTTHPMDIMTRGFDHLNRAFGFVEPPNRSGRGSREFKDDEIGCFAPISAASLVASRWFLADEPAAGAGDGPSITYENAGEATVRAPRGLRFVGLMRDGLEIAFRRFPIAGNAPPTMLKINAEDLRRAEGTATSIRVVDDAGRSIHEPAVFPAWFLRRWRIHPRTQPWPDSSRFVDADSKALHDGDAGRKVNSELARLDLLDAFGETSHDLVAYVASKVSVKTARKVRLRTGSDDALRVWIDEKLILSKLALRGARADDDTADVELAAGSHVLVAEVSQRGGDWALFARFEDEHGEPMVVSDDGQLDRDDAEAFLLFARDDPDIVSIRAALTRAGIETGWTQSIVGSFVVRRSDKLPALRALKSDPVAGPLLRRRDRAGHDWQDGDAPLAEWLAK